MSAGDDPTTEELRAIQATRESEERERQAEADDEAVAKAAERRADKAAYLKEKLEEQEASEGD